MRKSPKKPPTTKCRRVPLSPTISQLQIQRKKILLQYQTRNTKHETRELNDALLAVRNDVKLQMIKYLKEHDEVVVEKIKSFGKDMKKIERINDDNQQIK